MSAKRSRRKDGLRSREKLLDAATELFAELGFEATSVRALTDRADANVSAVNYHFGGKRGLYLAALERAALSTPDLLSSSASTARTLIEWLTRKLGIAFEAQGSDRPGLLMLMRAAHDAPVAGLVEMAGRVGEPLRAELRELLRSLHPTVDEAALEDASLYCMLLASDFAEDATRVERFGGTYPAARPELERRVASLARFIEGGVTALLTRP